MSRYFSQFQDLKPVFFNKDWIIFPTYPICVEKLDWKYVNDVAVKVSSIMTLTPIDDAFNGIKATRIKLSNGDEHITLCNYSDVIDAITHGVNRLQQYSSRT